MIFGNLSQCIEDNCNLVKHIKFIWKINILAAFSPVINNKIRNKKLHAYLVDVCFGHVAPISRLCSLSLTESECTKSVIALILLSFFEHADLNSLLTLLHEHVITSNYLTNCMFVLLKRLTGSSSLSAFS